ncbi:MAG: SRPBCC family protein [Candidatus Thiodiazotropha sp. (ex Codakia rugifera)]|nr:SRPBCC family protein [Candidatus Thiodiazotropha sp. (ex Codakia rugifera)]
MPLTDQSIVVNAPITEVWKRFSNFHDLSWASNVISKNIKVGNKDGDCVGAKRILNGVFHETLVEYLPTEYYLKYSIDDGPSPVSKEEVSNYFGVVKLSQAGDNAGTKVEWSSSWDSNSEDAVEFCHGIYVALLNDLSQLYP